jgi:hypothetical protein|tara:strand:+ start:576 stop:1196 length:621 start_codon:yes stop_codon:yes gene_type:complete
MPSSQQPPIFTTPFEKHRSILPHYLNSHGLTREGVEVGVLRGEFSKTILDSWQGKKLHLVDLWADHEDYDEKFHKHDDNYKIAISELKQYRDRIQFHRGFSSEMANTFSDESLDFVYLDANHSYAGCRDDIHAWYPKLKKGGLLCGDDYHPDDTMDYNGSRFGVTKAVNEFAIQKTKNVSVDWCGDWYFHDSQQNLIPSRNWYFFK